MDVLLQKPLIDLIHRQQLRHSDPGPAQALVVPQLRLQLISKGIVAAGFMVDLLQYQLLPILFHQIGISALPFSQKRYDRIGNAVDSYVFHHL